MWECSECDVEQELDGEAEEGQIIVCEECSAEFEIVSLEPLELSQLDLADPGGDEAGDAGDDDWGDD